MQQLTETRKTRRKPAESPDKSGNYLPHRAGYIGRPASAGTAVADFDACFSFLPSVHADLAAPSKWAVRLSVPSPGERAPRRDVSQVVVDATSEATAIAAALKLKRPAPGFRVEAVIRTS